jgi:2-phospho-L-lactate guanylyltransferase (CobY/MobA/RfbA family)
MVDSSMKPEQTYQDLKELAEKLGVVVSEQNFRSTGIKAKSGLCKVKGKNIVIIDKKLPLQDKNEVLASCLSKLSHEDIFMVPALREFLDSFHP